MRLPGAFAALLLIGCAPVPEPIETPPPFSSAALAPERRFRAISTEPVEVYVMARECRPIRDPQGNPVGCDIVHAGPVRVRTRRVRFIDDEGAEQAAYDPDPNDQPETKDGLCLEHRDRPVARLEHEARLLLAAADLLWREDSEASIRAYQRLLAEYPEFLHLLGSPIRIRKRAEQGD